MKYVPPGLPGSIVSVEPRYENFIGGKWLAPTHGKYRLDLAPATAGPITEVADSTPEDVELALDAAHAAKDAWGEASATERAKVLSAIADAIEKDVPVPCLTASLFTRFRSRQAESFAEKMLAALRNAFGGHTVKR